jgi:hypothetical protein
MPSTTVAVSSQQPSHVIRHAGTVSTQWRALHAARLTKIDFPIDSYLHDRSNSSPTVQQCAAPQVRICCTVLCAMLLCVCLFVGTLCCISSLSRTKAVRSVLPLCQRLQRCCGLCCTRTGSMQTAPSGNLCAARHRAVFWRPLCAGRAPAQSRGRAVADPMQPHDRSS